jgi:hypothetical protein
MPSGGDASSEHEDKASSDRAFQPSRELLARLTRRQGGALPPGVGAADVGQAVGGGGVAAAEPTYQCQRVLDLVGRKWDCGLRPPFVNGELPVRQLGHPCAGCLGEARKLGQARPPPSRRARSSRMSSRSLARAANRFVATRSSRHGITIEMLGESGTETRLAHRSSNETF